MNESYVWYASFTQAIKMLPKEEQAEAFFALHDYAETGVLPEGVSGAVMAIFILVKKQFDINAEKRANGNKGGRPKNNQAETEEKPNDNQSITKPKPNDNQSITKPEPNVYVNGNVYGNGIKDICPTSRASESENHSRKVTKMVTAEEESQPEGKEPAAVEAKPKKPKLTVYSAEFEKFWCEYPRNEDKKSAYEVWQRIRPSPELVQKMMEALKNAKVSSQWQEANGKYIPYAVRWLKKERWNDEIKPIGDTTSETDWTDFEASTGFMAGG